MFKISKIVCPVCKKPLVQRENSLVCPASHCFDIAKEGYVNLLSANHKPGELMGDNRAMALSRKLFLEKGYFSPLAQKISELVTEHKEKDCTVCDICCGEGWYAQQLLERADCELYCFDLSKQMVRLAAKRKTSATCFVANISSIPLEDSSMDVVYHLFAPFHEKEFSRILRNDGIIITVVPGSEHLYELKQLLYKDAYKNDEKPPEVKRLKMIQKHKVKTTIRLTSNEDILNLFKMTPYYYHTSAEALKKLDALKELEVTIDFAIFIYCL